MNSSELDGGKLTGFWGEVDAEGGDAVASRVFVQLRHQEIVVFHTQWKLLHIYNDAMKIYNTLTDGRNNTRISQLKHTHDHSNTSFIAVYLLTSSHLCSFTKAMTDTYIQTYILMHRYTHTYIHTYLHTYLK